MSLTSRVLLGLSLGLAAGILLDAAWPQAAPGISGWVEPIGTLWVNALRMTVVPLVFAGLVVGAASARDARTIGRIGIRAIALFLALLAIAAAFTVLVAPAVLAQLPIDPQATQALRASAGASAAAAGADVQAGATGMPDFRQWLVALVPTNPIRAAAEGTILPLILFALAFGLALARVPGDAHVTVVRFFEGVFEAMLALVRWILELAPWGVFALALPLATRMGLAAAGAVLFYIIVVCAICTLFIALLYPVAALLGRTPVTRFARAAAPAQAVAFSARSSLAALPAMIQGGQTHLQFGTAVTRFFLPLSAGTFRLGAAIGMPAGVLFIARLYGVHLDAMQLATVAVTAVLLTFSVPGVPGGSILIMMPVLLSVGLPAEAVGILLGVDTVPDMFRTTANVTGTMAAATILAPARSSDVVEEEAAGQRASSAAT